MAGRLRRPGSHFFGPVLHHGYAMLKNAKVLVDASGGPLLVNVVAEAAEKAEAVTAVPEGRARPVSS